MNEILVGTASWADKSLVDSKLFYPKEAKTAEARLRHYADNFRLVEVDSSYYALPAPPVAELWAQRTPDTFVFDIKAFRIFTQHQTPPKVLPPDIREALGPLTEKKNVYYSDFPPELMDEMWRRFRLALEPLRNAGKLGAVLFQFPPWFFYRRSNLAHIAHCAHVAYRRTLLRHQQRHLAALDLAIQKSGYGKRRLAPGRAWGVAVHEAFDTVVAYVVEASIRGDRPLVHAVTAGVHCNLAVNPRTIEAQVQSGMLMGLGTTLPGAQITLKDGVVQQSNWNDYRLPTHADAPKVAVHIVPSADPPTGIGECAVPAIAPALANAVAALGGKRYRSLPFSA